MQAGRGARVMDSIFISYRRTGTSGYGGRLQEDLREHFGRERVFRDIDSIRPGSDFAQVIEEAVARSGIVLALIGSNWLSTTNEDGQRRLDDPDDFVRLEIESALRQGIVVVPVLVEGAEVPPPSALPPSISKLGRTQAIELTDDRWDYDLNRLVKALEQVLGASPDVQSTPAGPATGGGGPPTATTVISHQSTPVVHVVTEPVAGPVGLRNPRIIAGVASVAVLLLIAVVVGLTRSDGSSPKVAGVVGQDVVPATATLKRAGFAVQTEEKPDPTRPAGVVVAQDPAAGTSLRKGATVRLSVSSNGSKVAVPSLLKLNRADAVAAIAAAGLRANIDERNDAAPVGVVFRQSPDPDTSVDRDSTVTLTVSTGATGTTGITLRPTLTTLRQTTTSTRPIPTGNLVTNPGAEDSPATAPFNVGQAPTGWTRGALQAIAAAYGATGSRPGCQGQPRYPTVAELPGHGTRLFTGGYGPTGDCDLPAGSISMLKQVISLTEFAGRTDGLKWEASVLLASKSTDNDSAQLTIDFLGGGEAPLATANAGPVTNNDGTLVFQVVPLSGRIPPGTTSVRLILSFRSTTYSAGFADDVSFKLG